MSATAAFQVLQELGRLEVVPIDLELTQQAIRNHLRFQTSYWDSLVVAAAQRAKCAVLYTEDLNEGQAYGGVVAANPFGPA